MTRDQEYQFMQALLRQRAQRKTRTEIAHEVLKTAASHGRVVKGGQITKRIIAAHKAGKLAPSR